MRDAVPAEIPVTVKMRRGIDDSAESRDRFYEIFDGAFALGVAAITVHGRTVMQRYDGPSRWEFLRELKQHAGDRVVLGQRRLVHGAGLPRHDAVHGRRWRDGRPRGDWQSVDFRAGPALAAGEPLPDPPTLYEQREVIREHYRLAEEIYGPERCLPDMRKFAIKYSQLHPRHLEVRADFCGVRQAGGWSDVLDRWYAADGPGVHPAV